MLPPPPKKNKQERKVFQSFIFQVIMIINCNEIINNKQQLYTMYTVYTRQTNISVNKHQQQTKHQPIPPTQETHSADTPPINDTSSNRDYLSLNTWPNSFQPLTQAKHCRWSLWRNIIWKLTIHVAWSKLNLSIQSVFNKHAGFCARQQFKDFIVFMSQTVH